MEGYDLEFIDEFDSDELAVERWVPAHLPQWSSRSQAAATYQVGGGRLVLQITEDQQPWCPEFDGPTRVSSLQTGVYSGPAGTPLGQHRFNPDVVVREPQPATRLYTPLYGYFEVRAKAVAAPSSMVAFWMIGFEDTPERSGEICICEIFGRDVEPETARIGVGVHPFGDPKLVDDFTRLTLTIDATSFHVYGARWTPAGIDFFVDGQRVKTVDQSPDYPMQFMLGIYDFVSQDGPSRGDGGGGYPREFVVDYVRGYRPSGGAQQAAPP